MAVHRILGTFLNFINGTTKLSATTFNNMQKSIQGDLNDKIECSDVRITDSTDDKACYAGVYPIEKNATGFPFDTSNIRFDNLDGLLAVFIPNGRSFGIQICFDPINKEFWLREGKKEYLSHSSQTGVVYMFNPTTNWEKIGGVS